MKSSILHIVITILLAITYVGEGVIPCAESLYAHCGSEQSCLSTGDSYTTSHAEQHHTGGEHHSTECHTDLCGCPCHTAGVEVSTAVPVAVGYTVFAYPSSDCSSPISRSFFPDHIPLA